MVPLENPTCSVCLGDLHSGQPLKELHQSEFRGHVFHQACINEWLQIQNNCPICRRNVEPDRLLLPQPMQHQIVRIEESAWERSKNEYLAAAIGSAVIALMMASGGCTPGKMIPCMQSAPYPDAVLDFYTEHFPKATEHFLSFPFYSAAVSLGIFLMMTLVDKIRGH